MAGWIGGKEGESSYWIFQVIPPGIHSME